MCVDQAYALWTLTSLECRVTWLSFLWPGTALRTGFNSFFNQSLVSHKGAPVVLMC